jgi:hypothetical protein
VDYLFIGTSRVPATINPDVFMDEDTGKIAVVGGRGYSTSGTHYQALKSKVREFPDYLRNSIVLVEYPGSRIYDQDFRESQLFVYEPWDPTLDKPMPHLMLPYLGLKDFFEFMKKSKNSFHVKIEMLFLYISSTYRTFPFIVDRINSLETDLIEEEEESEVTGGGLRSNAVELAREKALHHADWLIQELNSHPTLTIEDLDNSILARINDFVNESGGRLYLYEMPLHSLFEDIYETENELSNMRVFQEWLSKNDISVISNDKFAFSDADFPDIWHLGINKRDEFTRLLYYEVAALEYQIHKPPVSSRLPVKQY